MHEAESLPLLLTTEETAKFLRVGKAAVYEALREGKIPHLRIGSKYRIPRKALLAWIESVEPKQ